MIDIIHMLKFFDAPETLLEDTRRQSPHTARCLHDGCCPDGENVPSLLPEFAARWAQ